MQTLTLHPELKRPVRAEDWDGLASGTYHRISQALKDGAPDRQELTDYFVTEARIIFDIYTQWRRDTLRYLEASLGALSEWQAELERVHALSLLGRPALLADRNAAWAQILNLAEAVKLKVQSQAQADLDEMKDLWRHLHDSEVDYLAGLFDMVIRHLGEPALGEMYEKWVIGDWFDKRYKRFDISSFSWESAFPLIVYLTFESMHGHLAGPARLGDVRFESFDDRVEFTFAPCGSGGRTVIGEPLDGTPARMAPPYAYKVLEQKHDFAWNLEGVCTYCAHCCILTEKMPIAAFGYPVRVVDPPLYPNDGHAVCKWTVYRTPQAVPVRVYHRLGFVKPEPGATLGSAGGGAKRLV
jgi:hypothetical protein